MPTSRSLALLLAASLTGGLSACGDDDTSSAGGSGDPAAQATPGAPLPSDPVQAVADGALLLDVRTQEEWDEGHAKGAALLPLAKLLAGEQPPVAKDAAIIVYCRSGNRSAQAALALRRAGFTNVADLGPLDAWQSAGGEIVS